MIPLARRKQSVFEEEVSANLRRGVHGALPAWHSPSVVLGVRRIVARFLEVETRADSSVDEIV